MNIRLLIELDKEGRIWKSTKVGEEVQAAKKLRCACLASWIEQQIGPEPPPPDGGQTLLAEMDVFFGWMDERKELIKRGGWRNHQEQKA